MDWSTIECTQVARLGVPGTRETLPKLCVGCDPGKRGSCVVVSGYMGFMGIFAD